MFSARLFRVLVTPTTQAQIEERAERSWKLRDLLHLGNLNTPGSTVGDDGYLMKTAAPPMKPTPATRPTLVGKSNFAAVKIVSGKWVASGRSDRKQKDGRGPTYVGLRWHDQSGPDIIDAAVLLPRLKLRPHDQPRSYSVMPASCIHNGALVMAHGAHYYAVMSPRELKEYVSFNSAEE